MTTIDFGQNTNNWYSKELKSKQKYADSSGDIWYKFGFEYPYFMVSTLKQAQDANMGHGLNSETYTHMHTIFLYFLAEEPKIRATTTTGKLVESSPSKLCVQILPKSLDSSPITYAYINLSTLKRSDQKFQLSPERQGWQFDFSPVDCLLSNFINIFQNRAEARVATV